MTHDRAAQGQEAGAVLDYLGSDAPLCLCLHSIANGDVLRLAPARAERIAYVWRGAARLGKTDLPAGSSALAEQGADMALSAAGGEAVILVFQQSVPPSAQRGAGKVHLLPAASVPRYADPGGLAGGMHADGECETFAAWLHENHFAPGDPPTPEAAARGIHAHSEDEIIFVTAGSMRLGGRLFGPGTAIAIAADTFYGFTPGPDGLSFVNFRASRPGAIRFVSGMSVDEPGYWRERVARPQYVSV